MANSAYEAQPRALQASAKTTDILYRGLKMYETIKIIFIAL